MSMENAIEQHASALNNLAEAIRTAFGGLAALANIGQQFQSVSAGGAQVKDVETKDIINTKAAELAAATAERAKLAQTKQVEDAELEQAVKKVEADATATRALTKEEKAAAAKAKKDAEAAASAASSETDGADSSDDDGAVLDYVKDVRPVLLAAIKKSGKETVAEMVKTFGVDKADKIDPAKYGELLAKAEKLAA
jgi:regulator of protease activity HflC (stomatin/prohibitin superfamily)